MKLEGLGSTIKDSFKATTQKIKTGFFKRFPVSASDSERTTQTLSEPNSQSTPIGERTITSNNSKKKIIEQLTKQWLTTLSSDFTSQKKKMEDALCQLIKDEIGENTFKLASEYIEDCREAKKEYNKKTQSEPFTYITDEEHQTAYEQYSKTINTINSIANELTSNDSEFRMARNIYITMSLQEKYGTKFETGRKIVQFRAVIPNNDYGRPEFCFKNGFCPQLLTQHFLFQEGLFNEPFIVDSSENETKAGWTGGVVSHSAHLVHSAALTFLPKGAKLPDEYYVYATRARTYAPVSQHLDSGVSTLSEDAQENVLTIVEPEDVLYAIKINQDGTIDRTTDNPSEHIYEGVRVNQAMYQQPDSLQGDKEFIKFLNAKCVAELEAQEPDRPYNRSLSSSSSSSSEDDQDQFQTEWKRNLRNRP